MKWLSNRILWGIILIIGGFLFLIEAITDIQLGGLFWSVVFGLIAIAFFSLFFANRAQWWPLIPGVIFADLALVSLVNVLFPSFQDTLGGALFLAGLGLMFWVVYIINRTQWWAIIPGGVLITLAGVAAITSFTSDDTEVAGVFFLGLGLTFFLLGILPAKQGDMRWAFIPAAVLFFIGVAISIVTVSVLNFVWPILLILVGIYIIYASFKPRRV